jgi:uncharacterized coiled-coil DUF342 family protein
MSDDPIYDSMKRQEFRRETIDVRIAELKALNDDLENQTAELMAGMDQAESERDHAVADAAGLRGLLEEAETQLLHEEMQILQGTANATALVLRSCHHPNCP